MQAARATIVLFVIAASLPLSGQQGAPQRDVPAAARQERITATAPRAGLNGRVTSASNGSPLQRALILVSVSGRAVSRSFSDSEGRYEIDVPSGVPFSVLVTKSGYVPAAIPRPRTERPSAATLDISLARGAVLSGRVLDPLGNPVVSIRLRLHREGSDAGGIDSVTSTDDRGSFRVAGLLPGKYSIVTIGRPEYFSTVDPTLRLDPASRDRALPASSDPVTLDVASGDERDVAVLYREPTVILPYANVGGLVAGQVTDESGEPGVGLSVQLWRIEILNGIPVADRYGAARTTDDRGQYRLFHIKAGRYAIVVTDDAAKIASADSFWLPVYYPGTTSPSAATPLDIARSQELAGIDVAFTHTQGARVFGIATSSTGEPLKNSVSLIAPDPDAAFVAAPRVANVDPDGAFSFEAVPRGAYVLRGTSTISNVSLPLSLLAASPQANLSLLSVARDAEFAVQNVSVGDADVGPIAFRTAPPATLRGRIVFEDMPPLQTNFEIVAFTTDPIFDISGPVGDGMTSRAAIDRENWSFELPRVAGPTRLRLSAAPPDIWLKSAYAGTTNLAESPLAFLSAKDSREDVVVVISGSAGTVTGTVVDGAGKFSLSSLPPGEYWVVAIDSIRNELQRSASDRADLLESLTSSARRVTIGERQRVTVSPRVVTIP